MQMLIAHCFNVRESLKFAKEDGGNYNFRPEVNIWQFRECAMKSMQYNAY